MGTQWLKQSSDYQSFPPHPSFYLVLPGPKISHPASGQWSYHRAIARSSLVLPVRVPY